MSSGMLCVALLLMVNTFTVEARVLKPRQLYTGPGSTRNLKEIIIGRCSEYLLIDAHSSLVGGAPLDCNKIWDAFQSAFAYKDPCKPDTYQPFVDLTGGPELQDKALFWSGTMDLAAQYADNGRRKVVLANLLAGYLVKDNLNWCGSETSEDGINYENCPTYSDCDSQGEFWTDLSAMMAQRAVGVAYVLLNGTRSRPAYDKSSFFATVELPNLRKDAVQKVVALLAHDIDKNPDEICGKGSLKELEADVRNAGFAFECINDPWDVRHLMCVDAPNSKECQFSLKSRLVSAWKHFTHWG